MVRSPCLVDTNVPLVANGANPSAGAACQLASVDALQQVMGSRQLVIDNRREILDEYGRKLKARGGQCVGDLFYQWVLQNLWNPDRCAQVKITRRSDANGDFAEFPDAPELEGFDLSDRKFVATALAHGGDPEILVSYDTDWWDCREAFEQVGVRVHFLCEDAIRAASQRKRSKRR